MKRSERYGWFVVCLCVGLIVVGCASYYKVTDVQSGKEYYSQDVSNLSGGAVKVLDARTGSIVTLQNSEVKEISNKEFKAGLAAPVSTPTPTPVAAPVSAPTATPASAAAPAVAPTATPASAPSSAPAPEPTAAPAPASTTAPAPAAAPAPAPAPGAETK
jgi:hypothetical protein